MDIEKQVEELEKEVSGKKEEAVEEVEADEPEEKPAKAKAEETEEEADDESEEEASDEADDKDADEKAPTNADFARMRRELAEAKRKLKERDEKKEDKPAEKKEAKKDDDPEPDSNADPLAHARWEARQARKEVAALKEHVGKADPEVEAIKQERLWNQAERELDNFAAQVRTKNPDVDNGVNHLVKTVAAGLRATNVDASQQEIAAMTKKHVLLLAQKLMKNGYDNPVDGLYDLSVEKFDYKKAEEKAEEEGEKTEGKKKPDLEKLDKLKKRSASAVTSGGRNSKAKSLPSIDKITPAEFEKLSPEEQQEILEAAA